MRPVFAIEESATESFDVSRFTHHPARNKRGLGTLFCALASRFGKRAGYKRLRSGSSASSLFVPVRAVTKQTLFNKKFPFGSRCRGIVKESLTTGGIVSYNTTEMELSSIEADLDKVDETLSRRRYDNMRHGIIRPAPTVAAETSFNEELDYYKERFENGNDTLSVDSFSSNDDVERSLLRHDKPSYFRRKFLKSQGYIKLNSAPSIESISSSADNEEISYSRGKPVRGRYPYQPKVYQFNRPGTVGLSESETSLAESSVSDPETIETTFIDGTDGAALPEDNILYDRTQFGDYQTYTRPTLYGRLTPYLRKAIGVASASASIGFSYALPYIINGALTRAYNKSGELMYDNFVKPHIENVVNNYNYRIDINSLYFLGKYKKKNKYD